MTVHIADTARDRLPTMSEYYRAAAKSLRRCSQFYSCQAERNEMFRLAKIYEELALEFEVREKIN